MPESDTNTAIENGVWYIICKSNCGDHYHNVYAMGSKLWALGVDYRTKLHGAFLKDVITKAITHKNQKTTLFYRWYGHFNPGHAEGVAELLAGIIR